VSGVYKSLREKGRDEEAFAMKKKISRIAEEYEESLYKPQAASKRRNKII
jgi:hypothetical protein